MQLLEFIDDLCNSRIWLSMKVYVECVDCSFCLNWSLISLNYIMSCNLSIRIFWTKKTTTL